MSTPIDLTPNIIRTTRTISSTSHSVVVHAFFVNTKDNTQCVPVAVKAIKFESPEEVTGATNRLIREAQIWLKLQHPNIVGFLGSCSFPHSRLRQSTAIVSEFCPNGCVMDYLEANPEVLRITLITGIAQGLEYLHSKDIIHGDLTPANVLVKGDGVAAIGDFGRSKVVGRKGHTTMKKGTIRYSSPEAWAIGSTAALSRGSDVYSFAVVSTEVLTGKLPFYTIPNDIQMQAHIREHKTMLSRTDYMEIEERHWEILKPAWNYYAEERPLMSELAPCLTELVQPAVISSP
ncbi:hypothetical protein CCMSSC00406_0006818 [Pleurotus cornucopiae]|uniref:Uncharacterized protein n=1 Tax=Pleurotus cornucopiae TaxID=5321 RepID=A0ACB7J1R5_PLECO|nr:hypothetical protein CCMSSC00406_0006818 [Pleurotus cornucopiae]